MSITQRYLARFSYIGTSFRGSQFQSFEEGSGLETVQQILESGLKEIFKAECERPFKVYIISRTDSGVHALRSAFTVDLPKYYNSFLDSERLQYLMNRYFNNFRDIRVLEVHTVPDTFRIYNSCRSKTYFYRIGLMKNEFVKNTNKLIIPISEYGRTELLKNKNPLDIKKVEEAAHLFEGVKDFGAIIGRPSKNCRATTCNIMSFTIEKGQPLIPVDPIAQKYDFYQLTCKGNRFLFHMVRRMVGLAMAAGFGSITMTDIQKLFDEPVPSSWPKARVPGLLGTGLYLADVDLDMEQLNQKDQLPESTDEVSDITESSKEVYS